MEFKIIGLLYRFDRQHREESCDGNICGRKSVKLKILADINNIRKQR